MCGVTDFLGPQDRFARHIPGKSRNRGLYVDKGGVSRIVAGDRLALAPFRNIVDNYRVMSRRRVARRFGKRVENIQQANEFNLKGGFLAHLADYRVLHPFAIFKAPAGNRPFPLKGRFPSFNDQDLFAAKDDRTDADGYAFSLTHRASIVRPMCGRFFLKSTPAEVGSIFDVVVRDNFPPRYNVAPTQPIAIIRRNERRERIYALARWGFIPAWAKKDFLNRMGSKAVINARAETVTEKPMFRSAYKRRRCLVPADGYYEWKTEKGAKQPYCIRRHDDAPFAFGGIWETAIDGDGGEIDTAAILTMAAGPDAKAVHHREPVCVRQEDYAEWLEADERDIRDLERILLPEPAGSWRVYKVAKTVGNVRNDGPDLIEPIDAPMLF